VNSTDFPPRNSQANCCLEQTKFDPVPLKGIGRLDIHTALQNVLMQHMLQVVIILFVEAPLKRHCFMV
jgi:hypothetical protein